MGEKKLMTEKFRKANQPEDLDVIQETLPQKKSIKYANYIAGVSLILVALSISIFLKWSFVDTDVLVVSNSPFPARVVPDPSGMTGGIVFLQADLCKNTDKTGELRLSYISESSEMFLPLEKENFRKGCANKEFPVVIPLNLLNDKYRIKFRVDYDLNPIKKDVIVIFESREVVLGTDKTD